MLTYIELVENIKNWGIDLGFQQVGISDININELNRKYYKNWLLQKQHGNMSYMERNIDKRLQPNLLLENTLRIISVRIDYNPEDTKQMQNILNNTELAYISRYALGRDYHKLMRKRLAELANKIQIYIDNQTLYARAFVDSAPVLEKPLAQQAGLGWAGKHTNIVNKNTGSFFFLGELFINLPLPIDKPAKNHCGNCQKCIDICPTKAIIAPYKLDANLCISYLTIEFDGIIPIELRPLLGNRIYGCDDCQIVCPWNKFAQLTQETDFLPRQNLNKQQLLNLFNWTEKEFYKRTEGSAIRRIGYERWLRNISIALGNQLTKNKDQNIISALQQKLNYNSNMVTEHVAWAIYKN
jgi:epoxyqueuosine reductase